MEGMTRVHQGVSRFEVMCTGGAGTQLGGAVVAEAVGVPTQAGSHHRWWRGPC